MTYFLYIYVFIFYPCTISTPAALKFDARVRSQVNQTSLFFILLSLSLSPPFFAHHHLVGHFRRMIASRKECGLGDLFVVPNRRCAARHETVIEKEINSSTIPRPFRGVLPFEGDRDRGKSRCIYPSSRRSSRTRAKSLRKSA